MKPPFIQTSSQSRHSGLYAFTMRQPAHRTPRGSRGHVLYKRKEDPLGLLFVSTENEGLEPPSGHPRRFSRPLTYQLA